MSTSHPISWSLALLLPFAAWGAAEEEPVSPDEPFLEAVEVNLVNLEVFVTTRDGEPVMDLGRDDFEVTEDGKPVSLTHFWVVDDGARRGGESRAESPEETAAGAPGDEREPEALPPTPPEDQLHLIVYIDNFNIKPFNRNRVFRRLRQFITDNVRPGDRVMLVSYERSLHYRIPFTSDPIVVNHALLEMEDETGWGVSRESERRDMLREITEARDATFAQGRARMYAENLHNDLRFSVDAIKELIGSLGGLPGRKALLYVSDGLPLNAGEDLYFAIQEKFRDFSGIIESRQYDLSRSFLELGAQANSNRVTFYTIDAAGLRVHSAFSAENARYTISSQVESIYYNNLQQPLRMLADQTGGRAILNTNDVGAELEEVGRELRSYYSIAYAPLSAGDGRYHKIDVKVKRPKVRVRHREGYRDKSPRTQMEDRTLAALLYGYEENPLGIVLDFGSGAERDGGNFVVPVFVRIPLAKVVLVPRGELYEARLSLYLSALDDEGGRSPLQETPIRIEIPADEVEVARTQFWQYEVSLLMRPGRQRVAVGLRDLVGAEHSIVEEMVQVGAGG